MRQKYADDIIILDYETTSLIEINGVWSLFDTTISQKKYRDMEHVGIMYIWGLTFNGEFHSGRTWTELENLLFLLTEQAGNERLIIYAHNLPFEFQFTRNIVPDFEPFARKNFRPMKATSNFFNIEFRCSYQLTGYSLEKCADIFCPDIPKLTGNLDYKKIRHPETTIHKEELDYLRHDCLIGHRIISHFKKIYGNVQKIPLTRTGIVRRELQETLPHSVRREIVSLMSQKFSDFKFLSDSFIGGYTHGNATYIEQILDNIKSRDLVSAYPAIQALMRFPMTKFRDIKTENFKRENGRGYIFKVRYKNLKRRGFNTYLSISKTESLGYILDNGRIAYADEVTTTITDIDFDIIEKAYTYDSVEFIQIQAAYMGRLPTEYVKYIVKLFHVKQSYKNVAGKEEEYRHAKEALNAIYGMCVTILINDEIIFDGEWREPRRITAEEAETMLDEQRNPRKATSSYAWGVWTTAYARKFLWDIIIKADDEVVYNDTDSVKHTEFLDVSLFDEHNKTMQKLREEAAEHYEIPVEDFGNMGDFELDAEYDRFVTLGAKKYAYEKNGELFVTVSGLGKKAREHLKDISEFKKDRFFGYDEANKNRLTYNSQQPRITVTDYEGKSAVVNQRHGICVTPTTYKLGIGLDFQSYLDWIEVAEAEPMELLRKGFL